MEATHVWIQMRCIYRERGYDVKWNKTETDMSHDFTYTWNLKDKRNELNKNRTNSHTYRQQTAGCQTGDGRGKSGKERGD